MNRVRTLVDGETQGEVLRLEEPLSFWGGIDPGTGRIIERKHPQHDEVIKGRLISMPHGRGSSSASSILAETLRRGTGPAGIVLEQPDPILVVGALVAGELYGAVCPIVVSVTPMATGETWSLSPSGLRKVR